MNATLLEMSPKIQSLLGYSIHPPFMVHADGRHPAKQLDPAFVGRAYDHALLDALPPGADPCGENGEFHTFVHDGPGFSAPIAVETGERVERDGFWFADVVPADA